MGKVSAQTTRRHLDLDGIDCHYGVLDGFTVGFESYGHDEDPAPLFTGLPGNVCQSRHWGVVLEGTLVFRYTDGSTDVIEAGEAYYVPPGHLPQYKAGTRLIQFSPTDDFAKTMAVVSANVEAMRAG
jgi:hypothetical protein